jgi:hypothetical protein
VNGQYNSGMSIGVQPFSQTGTRTGEFQSGSMPKVGNGVANTLQSTNPGSYRPSSVIGQFTTSQNGQSPTTYEANRALSYYRQ